MEYLLTDEEIDLLSNGISTEHTDAMLREVPPQIMSLDNAANKGVLEILQTEKGGRLRDNLEKASGPIAQNSQLLETSFIFRGIYMTQWAREFWRFTLKNGQRVQLVKNDGNYKRVCPRCRTGLGYFIPGLMPEGAEMISGSFHAPQTVPQALDRCASTFFADIAQMRAAGDFDEYMRLIVATLRKLRVGVVYYAIHCLCIHRMTNGQSVIFEGQILSPCFPGLRRAYSDVILQHNPYFAPCDVCKGTGLMPEAPH